MQWIRKYAQLLAHYSLYLKKGELVYLRTTTLAHDLVSEFSKLCIDLGVRLEVEMDYSSKESYLISKGDTDLLNYFPNYKLDLIKNCDAYLVIRAPFSKTEELLPDPEKESIRSKVLQEFQDIYFQRIGNGSLKRSLCQFPTDYAANIAKMTLSEYEQFIIHACGLNLEHPDFFWKELSKTQQLYVNYLNSINKLVYEKDSWRVECSVKGRTWINSDGKSNMPSGEVFTSPIEDSVNGTIHFNYPTMMFGENVEDIKFSIKEGQIVEYSAATGQHVLDKVFSIDGTRRFGEVAIGTNFNIQQATNNILFDEKIGGTIHMAIGQSYYQCGGLNKSSIHWDLITDMTKGGRIYADSVLIYENGKFLI